METLLNLEGQVVAWLNQGIGRAAPMDYLGRLLVSDYFIPLSISLWMLGLWLSGPDAPARERNQRAVLGAAIALGFANLVVLMLNQHLFRERPLAQYELANLLYAPTDSSFPANSAAVTFAAATGIWLGNRRSGLVLFALAGAYGLVRIASGLHYPSDVAAGAVIGMAVALLVAVGLRLIEPVPTWVLRAARLLHLA